MRRATLGLALSGTLLAVLLFVTGRMLYIKLHDLRYEEIASYGIHDVLVLSENDTVLQTVTDEQQVTAFAALLSGYTYIEYPHFFKPGDNQLAGNRLTVTFENGASIGVNADGYVFVNGKLKDIEGGRGQEFYHKLYVLFYPNAA